jgi:tetratricopeptide (TPR) repeat protein
MFFLVILLVIAPLIEAQPHKGHHSDDDYKMTPMPAPPLRTGLGSSHLAITTKSPKAQTFFDQGLNLLHCFWDFEAYRAFKEVARLDPKAAMAYWGIVETIGDYPAMADEKKAALAQAKQLLPEASEHEQFYLRAQQKNQEEDGHDDWRREMEALIDRFPGDSDAKLFLAIKISYGYDNDGRPEKDHVYSDMLLRDVLRDHPDSAAAHHYRVHVLESGPHAGDAFPDAEVLAKLAPASGHMVHMPGHIYYKAGDYERARKSFLDSEKTDEDYMAREKVGVTDDWNYPHNLSYLIAADAEAGRYQEALAIAGKLQQIPANPFLGKDSPTWVLTVGGSTARLNARYRDWPAMIDRPISLGFDETVAGAAAVAYRDGVVAYARGMQALARKDLEAASHHSDALDAISWRLHAATEDESKTRAKNVLRNLQLLSYDLRGNLCGAKGEQDQAISLLKKAVDQEKEIGYGEPPQYGAVESESLGYAYIRGGKYDLARAAFQEALKQRPKNGHALYGIAQSYEAAGDKAAAARAYREFLAAWPNADPELAMVKHAQGANE